MTNQEDNLFLKILGIFNVPNLSMYNNSLSMYEQERQGNQNGFLARQVPTKSIYGKTHWTDFVLYIPDLIDVRIEVKELNGSGGLAYCPIGQLLTLKDRPEQYLIFLLEGKGFDNEVVNMFNELKDDNTFLVRSIPRLLILLRWIYNLSNVK